MMAAVKPEIRSLVSQLKSPYPMLGMKSAALKQMRQTSEEPDVPLHERAEDGVLRLTEKSEDAAYDERDAQ